MSEVAQRIQELEESLLWQREEREAMALLK